MLTNLQYLNIPIRAVFIIILIVVISQIIGTIIDLKKDVAPGILHVAKMVRQQKERHQIIKEVPHKMDELCDSVSELVKTVEDIKDVTAKNSKDILDININSMRNRYLDFASAVAAGKRVYSKEQWRQMQKMYDKYELVIQANNLTNGEMEISHEIVEEKYKEAMLTGNFLWMEYEK